MTKNALEMSDEDFLNTPLDAFEDGATAPSDSAPEDDKEITSEEIEDDKTEDTAETSEETEEANSEKDNSDEVNDSEDKEESDKKDKEEDEEKVEESSEDLKKLFAPFKANGKEISVKSVDEAIQLMQMGANYNKKMTALKPVMKVARMLENNDLLDEEKLSFLIDLSKKEPAAIAKFLKENDINPLEIDLESDVDYKSGKHVVSDDLIKVEEVLDSIKDSPTYAKVITTVTKEWDNDSRTIISKNPAIIAEINTHMQTGVYELISNEIERIRLFGGLSGLSDLAAYKAVGDKLNAQGAFDSLDGQKPVQVKPKTNSKPDPAIKEKRKAAAITKGNKAPEVRDTDFNPLALSDEEFEKMFGNKL